MKNLYSSLSIIGFAICFSVNGQTNNAKTNISSQPESVSSQVKSEYIKNQDYLSSNPSKYKTGFFGDSLKGFNEASIKIDLMSRGVSGTELINHINFLQRLYIKSKYHLGEYASYVGKTELPQTTPVTSNTSGSSKNIGGGSFINVAPCVNEDFEATSPGQYTSGSAVSGWTIESGLNSSTVYSPNTSYGVACNANGVGNWSSGSSELWIRQTPLFGLLGIGTLPNSPLGGTNIIQLNDAIAQGNYIATRLSSTFPVTSANTLFQFAYAGSWDGQHECCGQPGFRIDMYQLPCSGGTPTLMACSNVSLTPSGPSCSSGVPGYQVTNGVSWTNWVVNYIDLTPYIGTCVKVVVTNADCSYGGHHGCAYFDARCGGQLIGIGLGGVGGNIPGPVSFCAGSNQAVITAPLGYATYSWIPPSTSAPIPASQATLATLTITNPIPGSVYTVNLTGVSGCQFISTNTLVFSSVNIAGVGAGTTCANGSSGTATVQGNGSGTGYNYTWISASNNATVGNTAMVNGLAAGVYSIVLTGIGSVGCGSAVTTVTVTTGPPGIISVLKPFCSNEAYLGTTGGSNYQWYNPSLAPISASLGGTASSYTVVNPSSNSIYWLSYLSQYGCQDSVKFTLIASPPGNISVSNISWVCPGGSNGKAVVNLIPAPGSPPGINSYSVYSTGTTPAYSSSLNPTSLTNYTSTGLSAGTYSVKVFDGSCKYGASFGVNAYVFNYTLTPNSPTLCPGNCISANVNFVTTASLTQYSYSWTPTTFLAGGVGNQPNTIICPTLPIGTQSNIVYTVVVTPNVVNCPLTKTLSIVAVNPPTPTISAINNLCNTFAPYQIQTNPPGGTFFTNITGTNNPIGTNSGIITPSLANTTLNNGINTFTYSIAVNTCVARSTATYQVSKFNPATLTNTIQPLCVTNPPFNLMNIVQSAVNGTWTMPSNPSAVANNNLYPASLNTQVYTLQYSTTSSPNPGTCPDVASITVPITKTITPYITPILEFCTNVSPFSMTVSPSGGTWYNNSAISSAGVITPVLAAVPNSVTHYSIQIGPCVNTATSLLNVSKFNPAGFTATISNLCNTTPPVNLMSIVQSTVGGVWYGPNNAVSGNTFAPITLTTGVYTLTYTTLSFPNTGLCPDIRTIDVSVLNPQMPNITSVGPFCSNGAPIQLTVTPAIGKWTASPYLTPGGLFSPSLTAVGNNPVQYVVGTSTCNVQQTKFISIEAFVSAKIMSQLPDQCSTGSPVNLGPLTLSSLGVWSGAGISGTTFNPGLTGAGTFTLLHQTASSPSGLCPDADAMAVNVFSLATPVIPKVGPFCNSFEPFQLKVSPVGGLFGGANMGVVSIGGKFDPASAFIGDNIINYSITSGPCIAYAQTTISVERYVSADFEKPVSAICLVPGMVSPINMNSYVQNPGGKWSNYSGKGVTGNMFDPFKANIGKNNIVLYETNSATTTTLCPDTSFIRIEVRDVPKVTAFSNTSSACSPGEILFNTPSVTEGVGGIGTWYFDDGSEPERGFNASHIFTKPGTYIVTFTYEDDIGCKALPAKVKEVVINEIPKADFSVPDEIFISNPDIQLTNMTTVLGDNTYVWKVGNLLQYEVNPVVSLPKIGRYQITLTATSVNGCKDEITKTIEVKNDFNIYIPSSFSPNFDGLNDIFVPVFSEYGLDLKSFEMEIFDRWGHSLYRSKDANKGWDGSVGNKGEPLKEEVYIYRIKYKDLDGNAYSKMGHVSLIK